MINKKNLLIITGVLLSIFGLIYNLNQTKNKKPAKSTYSTLEEYSKSIDYSCTKDSDCVIKNVGNCCGIYPECVNKNATVDPDFVNKACEKEQLGGICGFPSIDTCRCTNSRCEGFLKDFNLE